MAYLAAFPEMPQAGSGPVNGCSDNFLAIHWQFYSPMLQYPFQLPAFYVQPLSLGIYGNARLTESLSYDSQVL
jgi:hypothetical protein